MHRVAFITGASSGLGREISIRLAREGFRVALVARRAGALEEVAGEIRAEGGCALVCPCDVTDRDAVHRAVARAAAELGPVDLMVANAGLDVPMDARSLDGGVVERVLDVNLMGAVHCVEAALPAMLERGRGQLAAIGSLGGLGGLPGMAAYSASKGALHNFFESLRLDLRGSGVDVTLVTPGHVRTPMVAGTDPADLPFLMDADLAGARIVRGILQRRRLVSFPHVLAWAAWWGQILPARIYDALAAMLEPSSPADT